jgi:hypothetical protein
MALFAEYTNPGVYVQDSTEEAGIPLFGVARVPVLVGEGEETRSFTGINLHRGSSTYTDEQVVRENLSAQVDGLTRKFKLTYFPVVNGDGKGTITSEPASIKVYANDLPILVSALNGTMGEFTTQSILAVGTDLRADYYFKRMDTHITNEDLSLQIPTFASVSLNSDILVAPSTPGNLGNLVSVALTAKNATLDTQGISFSISKTGVVGTEAKVNFVSGGSLGAAVTALTTLTITVTGATTIADVLGLTLPALTLSTGAATLTATLQSGHVATESVVAGAAAASLTIVGATDGQAVTGLGTDAISVEITKEDGSLRTNNEIARLLNSGVSTLSGGILLAQVVANGSVAAVEVAPSLMTGGNGPGTNKSFSVVNVPIVDGTNGGVVTTNPDSITVTINDLPVKVVSVNGLYGTFTLAQPVAAGSKFRVNYYTNNYQDTFDVLPGDNIVELTNVGYGAGRSDFIDGVDFVLEKDSTGARIQWGASASVKAGKYTTGYAPFDGTPVTTTLVDEYVYLRPVSGAVDGKNYSFQLEDVPTDGSLLSRATNDPSKIAVYAGSSPLDALSKGPIRVVSLFGANRDFSLYTPTAPGQKLYASYWRNVLNDHLYTLTVAAPGVTGQGTYRITDELGNVAPVAEEGVHTVTAGTFANTGIVWPYSFPDLRGQVGATPNETITLTFQDDGLTFDTSVAVQAYTLLAAPGLRFRATNFGIGPNAVTSIALDATTNTADAAAVTKSGEVITVAIKKTGGTLRSLQDIINLFTTPTDATQVTTTLAGRIICEPSSPSTVLTSAAVAKTATTLTNGAAATTLPYSNRFKVTSSRTDAALLADAKGRTGGAQTPVLSNIGVNAVGLDGYLGQTYLDPATAVQFTLVDPNIDPLANPEYGLQTTPSPSYRFQPGDKLVFTMNSALARPTSAIPTIDVPGLRVRVTSTYNMETGSTALVQTYNKAGAEPKIGEFYYVDYKTQKTAKDFAIKVFSSLAAVYAEYGQPSATNKLSLAARLFNQNGGQLLACIQTPKQLGMDTASDQEFMAAIDTLAQPLPGSENKASVIVPLTTSAVVQQYLNRHLITQGSQRMGGEAIAYIGFDFNTTPNDARRICRSIKSERMVAAFPGGAILTMDIGGKSAEFAVGGEFIAAAMAGMDLNPAYDVATSLTRKNIVGFDRLIKRYDDLTMDLAAADGLCWLVERAGALQVRHYITTDPSNVITREPSNRKVADSAHFRLRQNLDQFIARKILTSLVNDITVTTHATMKAMIEQELVENYKDLVVTRDAYDPTVIHVSLKFKPVFSLMWLDVNLTVTTRI